MEAPDPKESYKDFAPQEPILIGEKVTIKGCEFRVASVGRRKMILDALPGTRMVGVKPKVY